MITGALREAFINMLTHSDYLNDRVTLKISQTSNTLNFENPGVMLVSILEAQSGKNLYVEMQYYTICFAE